MHLKKTPAFILAFILALILLISATQAFLGTGMPNFFYEDDSYFYLQIARNISQGFGSTFDGINPTNGYHPLWMWVVTIIAFASSIFTQSKLALLFFVTLLSNTIVFTIAFKLIKNPFLKVMAIASAYYCGFTMEAILLALIAVLFVNEAIKIAPNVRTLSALAFIFPLIRIDTAYIPILVSAYLFAIQSNINFKSAITIVVMAALGALINISFQKILFGELYTVSSYMKASGLNTLRLYDQLLHNYLSFGNLLRFLVLGITGFVIAKTKGVKSHYFIIFSIFTSFVFVHGILSYLRDWYFAVSIFAGIAITDGLFKGAAPKIVDMANAGVSIILVFAGGYYIQAHATDIKETRKFISSVNEKVGSDQRIFQIDGSGYTGYWLNAHVVNGDGLVNSFEYAKKLKRNQLKTYVADNKICYLLRNSAANDSDYLADFHGLQIRKDAATAIVETGETRNNLVGFRIYRLNCAENI